MRLLKHTPSIALLTFVIFIVTCKKNDAVQQATPPVANAGADQNILLPNYTAILKSEGPDNPVYLWKKISGPAEYEIDSPRAKSTRVTNLVEGIYLFELKVTNSQNHSANDTVKFTVEGTGIAPVAIAGPDTTISLRTCNDNSGRVKLDGNKSFDPDHTLLTYKWTILNGPQPGYVSNPNDAYAEIQNVGFGHYVLELLVRDEGGKTSRDTINLVASYDVSPIDLGLSLNSNFWFSDNYDNSYYYGTYSDLMTISEVVIIPGRGDFQLDLNETSDTSNTSEQHATTMNLYDYNGNDLFLSGECSVNFKRLIVTGGGAFSGTIKVTNTSALNCDTSALNKMSPLKISGNLDTATKKVTINLQGKIIF